MEPKPPQSSTPPPPMVPPIPPRPPGAQGSGTPALPAVCPSCQEPRILGARYCEECGHDYGPEAAAAPDDGGVLRGPVLWIFAVFWIALAVAGLMFLFSGAWQQ